MALASSTSSGGGASTHKRGAAGGRREGPAVRTYPGSTGGRGGRSGRRVAELEQIEFVGASSITEYSRALRELGRDLAAELLQAADEVEAVLSRQKGHPLLMGLDCRIKARRTAARLKRAAEAAGGIATEAVKFNTEFRVQFADVLTPQRQKRPQFNWES